MNLISTEFQWYLSSQGGQRSRMHLPSHVCPTILHSYGNCFRSCPCECRPLPFAESSLVSRGLRGVFVQSQRSGKPRYLHPTEVATLLAVPLSMDFTEVPRASLALLGLAASPLQSLWVFAHLVRAASVAIPGLRPLDPISVLDKFKSEILRQVRQDFPFASPPKLQSLSIFHRDGPAIQLMSPAASTVSQLLQAESISLDWGQSAKLFRGNESFPLAGPILLSEEDSLYVERSSKRQCLDRPTGLLMVALNLGSEAFVSFLKPGAFLFQVLWEHSLSTDVLMTDRSGRIYGPDFKIWSSQTFDILDALRFPTIVRPLLVRPAGSVIGFSQQAGGSPGGLDDQAVWKAMQELRDSVPCWLVSPLQAWSILGQLDTSSLDFMDLHESPHLFVIFANKGHWGLLYGHLEDDELHWLYLDGLPHSLQTEAFLLAQHLSLHLGFGFVPVRLKTWICQTSPVTCGTIAIAHMVLALGLPGKFTDEAIDRLHGLLACRNRQSSWMIGRGPDTTSTLSALLVTKGVPADAAASRAAAAIKKLGESGISQALGQANSWQALKALTSKPGCSFQFVLKTELQDYINSKASSKHGAQISSSKKLKKVNRRDGVPWNLDPKLLTLAPGHFQDPDGDQVDQVSLDDVVADARGIALCTVPEATWLNPSISVRMLWLSWWSMRFPLRPVVLPQLLLWDSRSLFSLRAIHCWFRVASFNWEMFQLSHTCLLIQSLRWTSATPLSWRWFFIVMNWVNCGPKSPKVLSNAFCSLCQCCGFATIFTATIGAGATTLLLRIFWTTWFTRFGPAGSRPSKVRLSLLRRLMFFRPFFPRSSTEKSTDPDYAVVWVPGATRSLLCTSSNWRVTVCPWCAWNKGLASGSLRIMKKRPTLRSVLGRSSWRPRWLQFIGCTLCHMACSGIRWSNFSRNGSGKPNPFSRLVAPVKAVHGMWAHQPALQPTSCQLFPRMFLSPWWRTRLRRRSRPRSWVTRGFRPIFNSSPGRNWPLRVPHLGFMALILGKVIPGVPTSLRVWNLLRPLVPGLMLWLTSLRRRSRLKLLRIHRQLLLRLHRSRISASSVWKLGWPSCKHRASSSSSTLGLKRLAID